MTGNFAGRVLTIGNDRMGRFCWYTVLAKHNEGILFITACRVCQEAANKPGPQTAFGHKQMALRQERVSKPNLRKDILTKLNELI